MRRSIRVLVAGCVTAAALTGCGGDSAPSTSSAAAPSQAASVSDYPQRNLDWTIAFGPGGGNDIMARTMVKILQDKKLYPQNIAVQNREGGSGATGWGYLFSKRGNPYNVSTTSGSFITTPLQANTGWTYKDFTPVGLFATDDAFFVVPPKTGIKTWQEWVDYAKKKGKVAVGGIGTVNVDFILHSLLAEKAGYQIDYVPFNEEGQLQTSLFSGSLDAIVSNTGSILGQVQANKVTPLLFTGKQPLDVLPSVPTGESLGYPDLVSQPRGLILPPDMPPGVRDWWIATMKQVVATPEWKEYLAKNYLTENVRWGDEFGTFLVETSGEFERILKERGAVK